MMKHLTYQHIHKTVAWEIRQGIGTDCQVVIKFRPDIDFCICHASEVLNLFPNTEHVIARCETDLETHYNNIFVETDNGSHLMNYFCDVGFTPLAHKIIDRMLRKQIWLITLNEPEIVYFSYNGSQVHKVKIGDTYIEIRRFLKNHYNVNDVISIYIIDSDNNFQHRFNATYDHDRDFISVRPVA